MGSTVPVVRIGWPDQFIEHGKVDLLRARHGLTVDEAQGRLLRCWQAPPCNAGRELDPVHCAAAFRVQISLCDLNRLFACFMLLGSSLATAAPRIPAGRATAACWRSPAARSSTSPIGAAPPATLKTPLYSSATATSPTSVRHPLSIPKGAAGHRLHGKIPYSRPDRRLCGHELAGAGQRQPLHGRHHCGGPRRHRARLHRLRRVAQPAHLPHRLQSAPPTTGACWPGVRNGWASCARAAHPV